MTITNQNARVSQSRLFSIALILVATLVGFQSNAIAQGTDRECQSLISQINDSVDKVAKIGEQIGEYDEKLYEVGKSVGKDSEQYKSIQNSIESMKGSLRQMKVTVEALAQKLCDCCGKEPGKPADSHMQCNALISQINDSVDKVAKIGEQIGEYDEKLYEVGKSVGKDSEQYKSIDRSVQSMKDSLNKAKLKVETLATQLCDCCAGKPEPKDYKRACDLFLGYQHNRVDAGEYIGFNGFEVALGCPVQRYIDLTGSYSLNRRSEDSAGAETKATIHQFLGGITIQDNATDRTVNPFAHLLLGATHHRFSFDSGTFRSSGSETGFAGAFGGGVDVRFNDRWGWRALQVDYNPNRVNDTWQHNFRLSTGIVLRLGAK